jgi:hypothetical protein
VLRARVVCWVTLGLAGIVGCGSSGGPGSGARSDARADETPPPDAAGKPADVAAGIDLAVDLGAADAAATVEGDAEAAIDAGGAPDANQADAGSAAAGAVVWAIDNVKSIGGHAVSVLGAPAVIDTPQGKAVQFDGKGDALLMDYHPLAGIGQFTAEMIFRPDATGPTAQRVFHMQENATDDRVLFEIRLMNGNFFLDVVLKSGGTSLLLYTAGKVHPAGAWYAVAVVVDGTRARTYVDGVEQTTGTLAFKAPRPGRTSIGVRITKESFFKGAIRLARFTPRPLTPAELLAATAAP